jgi:sulfide:quinone oxidoreductase
MMKAKIVALTGNFSVASQIAADDISQIADAGYRTLINNRPDDEEPGQLQSADARRQAEALGIAYHYLPFTAASLTTAEIVSFENLMARTDGPILAHCRSGTRCYLLWAAAEMRRGAGSAESLIQQAAERGFDIAALRRFSTTS